MEFIISKSEYAFLPSFCSADGEVIGFVTSGTMSPSLGKAIGLAYVAAPLYKASSEIFIKVRGKLLKAVVVKTPFYKSI